MGNANRVARKVESLQTVAGGYPVAREVSPKEDDSYAVEMTCFQQPAKLP